MAKLIIGIITSCMFMLQWRQTYCYMRDDMIKLIEDLFNETRYSKLVRPIYNQDKVMEVNITPGIMTFESLDVTTGALLTISYIQISWIDEYLIWNPADYAGIKKLPIPLDLPWIPSLSQYNGALSENTGQIINPGFAPVIVLPTGFVLLVTTGYYVTKCDIDTRFYPFDSHTCQFTIFSGLRDTTEIELNSHMSDFALGMLQDNPAWYHTNTKYKRLTIAGENIPHILSGVQFNITLRRRPTFEIVNSYIPILLLTVLNMATNFVPANSGERLSFAITLYLSFIFITSALVNEMPHVAINIALSSYIMLSLNALNTTSVLWSVLIVRMSGWKTCKRQIPRTLQKIVVWYHKNEESSKKTKVYPALSVSTDKDLDLHPEVKDQDTNENASNVEVRNQMDALTWLEVTEVLDRAYFTVTTVLVACVILVMICLWMLSE